MINDIFQLMQRMSVDGDDIIGQRIISRINGMCLSEGIQEPTAYQAFSHEKEMENREYDLAKLSIAMTEVKQVLRRYGFWLAERAVVRSKRTGYTEAEHLEHLLYCRANDVFEPPHNITQALWAMLRRCRKG